MKLKTEEYKGYKILFEKQGNRILFSIPQLQPNPGYAMLSDKPGVESYAKFLIDKYVSENFTKDSGVLKGSYILDKSYNKTNKKTPDLYWKIEGRTILFKYKGIAKILKIVKKDGYSFSVRKTQIGTDNIKGLINSIKSDIFGKEFRRIVLMGVYGLSNDEVYKDE